MGYGSVFFMAGLLVASMITYMASFLEKFRINQEYLNFWTISVMGTHGKTEIALGPGGARVGPFLSCSG